MKTNTDFILLGGDTDSKVRDLHNQEVKRCYYDEKDLLIEKLLAENKELTRECKVRKEMYKEVVEELEEKTKECEAKEEENKELKKENEKLNEIVVVGKTEIALRDETINKMLSQPRVRRLKANAVKDVINWFVKHKGDVDIDIITDLASKHNVAIKTIINLYTRKTHVKAWSMLNDEMIWDIKQDIVNLI